MQLAANQETTNTAIADTDMRQMWWPFLSDLIISRLAITLNCTLWREDVSLSWERSSRGHDATVVLYHQRLVERLGMAVARPGDGAANSEEHFTQDAF